MNYDVAKGNERGKIPSVGTCSNLNAWYGECHSSTRWHNSHLQITDMSHKGNWNITRLHSQEMYHPNKRRIARGWKKNRRKRCLPQKTYIIESYSRIFRQSALCLSLWMMSRYCDQTLRFSVESTPRAWLATSWAGTLLASATMASRLRNMSLSVSTGRFSESNASK